MFLADALGIGAGDVVALTGGGGKTSALYCLGRELAGRGLPVFLTGTTRFTPPAGGPPPNLHLVTAADSLESLPLVGPWPVTLAAGYGRNGRLQPLDAGALCHVSRTLPGAVVVIEADGSAMRPFKAPADHEPVIPPWTTLVVSACGLDVLGRPLDERAVHRPERVAALTGAIPGTTVDAALVASVLLHPRGGGKDVPASARRAVLLNKADTPERWQTARQMASLLLPGVERVVISCLRCHPPAVQVLPSGTAPRA